MDEAFLGEVVHAQADLLTEVEQDFREVGSGLLRSTATNTHTHTHTHKVACIKRKVDSHPAIYRVQPPPSLGNEAFVLYLEGDM